MEDEARSALFKQLCAMGDERRNFLEANVITRAWRAIFGRLT